MNVGLRTERETVPRYSLPGGDTSPIIEFGFGEKLAPRLGAVYDVNGDGRWKLYGSWGVFYDIFKYSLSTAFGGYDSVQYAFTLDTYDWPTLLANPACPPTCPGTRIVGPASAVNVADDAVDPDLDPMKLQEAVVGIEHQLRPHLLLTARYVHKQLDRAVEDIGSLDANYNEIYTVGNPGFHRATLAYPLVTTPDSLHYIFLAKPYPNWRRFYRNLRYVVIDEAHIYKGILGANMANIIRRLLIRCRREGNPQFPQIIISSATVRHPGKFARQLTGLPESDFEIITESGAPKPGRHSPRDPFGCA